MRKGPLALLFLFGLLLTACASTPDKAYWTDPHWVESMERAFNFYYPAEAVLPDLPFGEATVVFTYQDGRATDVRILKSTGSTILDGAVMAQLERAQFPKAYGLQKLEAHDFQFDIELAPSIDEFAGLLRRSIEQQTVSNLYSQFPGQQGYVFVGFDYLDGKISDAKPLLTAGEHGLGDAVVQQLTGMKAPKPIPAIAGQKIHFTVSFCFKWDEKTCDVYEREVRAKFASH